MMKINNFQMPESIVKEESTYTDTFGRFIVQPLERGYGVTLGNSMRRISYFFASGQCYNCNQDQ
jgi:hypothetical protein